MKATFKGRYEGDKSSAAATVAVAAGDLRLKASLTDATVLKSPSLNGLSLSLEKPGHFIFDFNVPKQDVRFQFMNTVRVADKPVNLTYTHAYGDGLTAVDAAVSFDPANKVSVSYPLGSGGCKLKYSYAHGEMRRLVFEPCYHLSRNAWDFAVTKRFEGGDSVKGTYQTSSRVLGLEWCRESMINGSLKISASVNINDQQLAPKLIAESTWNFEM